MTWFGEALIATMELGKSMSVGAGGPAVRFSGAEVALWANESEEIAVRLVYGKLACGGPRRVVRAGPVR